MLQKPNSPVPLRSACALTHRRGSQMGVKRAVRRGSSRHKTEGEGGDRSEEPKFGKDVTTVDKRRRLHDTLRRELTKQSRRTESAAGCTDTTSQAGLRQRWRTDVEDRTTLPQKILQRDDRTPTTRIDVRHRLVGDIAQDVGR